MPESRESMATGKVAPWRNLRRAIAASRQAVRKTGKVEKLERRNGGRGNPEGERQEGWKTWKSGKAGNEEAVMWARG
ncbi:MAG TPA: hypothetical protein VHE61_11135, partial [Opitutaceae bacterium]|nr:hypothetical protein [Opitutaceae bacterium]